MCIDKLREVVQKSENIVFFGGAGVSTESGIPDFRSVDGLYSKKYKYPPENQEQALEIVMKQAELMCSNEAKEL